MNGYKKIKNLDQRSALAAQDWLSLMSESGNVAIDNRRKATFGHSMTGSQSLDAIYRRDSIDGPWFRRDPLHHSLTRQDIIKRNTQRQWPFILCPGCCVHGKSLSTSLCPIKIQIVFQGNCILLIRYFISNHESLHMQTYLLNDIIIIIIACLYKLFIRRIIKE